MTNHSKSKQEYFDDLKAKNLGCDHRLSLKPTKPLNPENVQKLDTYNCVKLFMKSK